jgi:hypothetical protein
LCGLNKNNQKESAEEKLDAFMEGVILFGYPSLEMPLNLFIDLRSSRRDVTSFLHRVVQQQIFLLYLVSSPT